MDVDIDTEQLFTEEKPKNYAHPDVLCHTFDLLSSLHKLLPNHLVEVLHSYRKEEDKTKCMWVEGGRECLYLHAGVSPLLLDVGTNFLTLQVPSVHETLATSWLGKPMLSNRPVDFAQE